MARDTTNASRLSLTGKNMAIPTQTKADQARFVPERSTACTRERVEREHSPLKPPLSELVTRTVSNDEKNGKV